MNVTQVALDDDEQRGLTALAARLGVSEPELIREGIRHVLAAADRPRPRAGFIASTDGGSAADVDADLARFGFGE